MNFRITGQKINIATEAKYLGLKLDQHLTFKQHMDTIKLKLNIENSLLTKIRYHVGSKLLKQYILLSLNLISDTAANYGGRPKPKSLKTLEKSKTKHSK